MARDRILSEGFPCGVGLLRITQLDEGRLFVFLVFVGLLRGSSGAFRIFRVGSFGLGLNSVEALDLVVVHGTW